VFKADPGAGGLYVLVAALLTLIPVAQVWASKLLLDHLTTTRAAGVVQSLTDPAAAEALGLGAAYVLTLVAGVALQPLEHAAAERLQDRAVADTDGRLMDAGAKLVDLCRIERPAFGDELAHIRGAVYYPRRLVSTVVSLLSMLVTVGGLLLLLARLHPLVPLGFLAGAVPRLLAAGRFNQLMYAAFRRRSRAVREADYCARVTTQPDTAKEVRVLGLGRFFERRFRDRYAASLVELAHLRLARLRLSALFDAIYVLVLAAGFGYVALQAGAGRLTLGDMALFLGAMSQAQNRIADSIYRFGGLDDLAVRLRGLFAFLDTAGPEIKLAPPGHGVPVPAALAHGIELRDVRFRFPEGTGDVLSEVSAMLPTGKVTALVGANGAGKSTLVKLLTRMYDPTHGEIFLDGRPLADYDLGALRGREAAAYQDFARLALTLRQNIAVGAHAASGGTAGVEAAAHWAGVDELAASLPRGYDTPLTRRLADGVELSAGEWQKVALARAFVREAAVVILDEPTAALDADAEYQLFKSFRALAAGRTALLISHRLSTVRMADHIVVLEKGHIAEAGSHEELIARGGSYATLFEMQAGRYR
jgi:ATP-binding cassette, subfamily B, bacterial